MKGDFTRRTFRDDKHFTRVLMQQGRVQLDADWNEQLEIDAHAAGTTHTDVIGGCGVPKDGGGFAIGVTADGHDLTIAPGRIYVDGILCEFGSEPVDVTALTADRAGLVHLAPGRRRLRTGDHLELSGGDASVIVRVTGVDADARRVGFEPSLDTATRGALGPRVRARRTATYATQPDLPSPPHVTVPDEGPPAVALDDGTYLVYLDVWERHVTTVEDPELLEPALGGPDTTTRVQNVAQIRLARLAGGASTCADVPGFDALAAADAIAKPSTGRLAARATPEVTTGDCTMPEAAGFRGLENQLYRVEVHTPGPLGTATFKWSRDNGTVVTRWLGQHGHDLEVADTGRDEVLSFAAGQTVELTDASRVMAGEPGLLTTVHAPPRGDVLPVDPADAVSFADFASDPIVRRWDSDGDEPTADGWIALEHGVEVRFTDGWYNTGDFWLIPARTATGTVDWPRDDDDPPLERSPEGIVHGRCRLAVVRSASGSLTPLDDCRERCRVALAVAGRPDQPEHGIRLARGLDCLGCELP